MSEDLLLNFVQVPRKCTTRSTKNMHLQLKPTQLNSARRKEETLLCCIAEGDRSTALRIAEELRCVVKPQVEVSKNAIKFHPSAYGIHITNFYSVLA